MGNDKEFRYWDPANRLLYSVDPKSPYAVRVPVVYVNYPYYQKFPYTDEDGKVWLDPFGIPGSKMGECFICGQETIRVDISYYDYFCNSEECNETINNDLRDKKTSDE